MPKDVPFNLDEVGRGLAFATHMEEFLNALSTGACVVQAPPGSGKTTLAPPAVANHLVHNRIPGKVLISAPRRIAVRAGAQRLCDLTSTRLGENVGFTIRGERAVSRRTLVEFLTPGVLLRRLLADPELSDVGAVILDEVHERSVDIDLLVAMAAELRLLREDLHLVVMSATVDAQGYADLLGGVPVVHSTGEQHPVEVLYRPFEGARLTERGVSRDFLDHVAACAQEAVGWDPDGDILVFLPGRPEIRYVSDQLRNLGSHHEVLPLYSGVDPEVRHRILRGRSPKETPRFIISTDVAESSLTVPGVHTVVDACLSRESRRDQRRGMSGLVTVSAARSSCEQRAGRAGRLGPGRAYRCISETAFAQAPAHPTPEVFTADLTSAALTLACWGAPGAQGMTLPDPLPDAEVQQAHEVLQELGALDAHHRPLELGRRLASLPVDPVLGSALLRAAGTVGPEIAAQVVALLSLDLRAPDGDLQELGRSLAAGRHPATQQWRSLTDRLKRLATGHGDAGKGAFVSSIGPVAALGPGRIARWDGGDYLLASGTRASLRPGSSLSGSEWLVVTNVARSRGGAAATTGALIHAAAPITKEEVERIFPAEEARIVEVSGGRVTARIQRAHGAIVDSSVPVAATREEQIAGIIGHIRDQGVQTLPWSPLARAFRGRLAALRTHLGAQWPDVSDAALSADLSWIESFITTGVLADAPVLEALQSLVWNRGEELDRLAPERIRVPSGRHVRLEYPYPHEGQVRAAVKLQECFGMRHTPMILDGNVPITLELLSPAGRPVAVTSDLEFFWSEVYPQVRAENRARYAKHPWPQDPWTHVATAATNRQLRD